MSSSTSSTATPDVADTIRRLERRVRRLQACTIVAAMSALILSLSAFVGERGARHSVLDVERINVREPDGTLRLVLSNRARSDAPIARGRPFGEGSGTRAGLIFFNDEETEVGGLVFGGRRQGGSVQAGASLTFDRHDQDQVVQITYQEQGGPPAAGLVVTDRPSTMTTPEYVALRERARRAEGADGERLRQELAAREAAGEFWAQRVFVGSLARSAMLRIKDTRGRTRVRLLVDSTDVARLEFLDDSGRVVHTVGPAHR
ncbi:MAG: hypothetical protein MUE41_13120 [Gemmatimonadaceae bacterium]|jgi:hypothetical protein|nr:hypothetical protein [Gemmatimonadaceae bacterium]